MKTKLLMMGMVVAAMTFTSCSKDDNGVEELQNGELRLSSGVSVQTRAFGIDTQINKDQKVAVYVDKAGDASTLYGNNVLKADGGGGFTDGTTMFFPADKSNVDIYAIATNGTLTTDFPTAAITHTVAADQKEKPGYAASDLLYSTGINVAFSKLVVPLTFYHMLTKVEVALVSGAGTPDLTGATVKIFGTKLKADFIPSKSAAMDTQSERAAMITATSDANDAAPITIGNASSTDFADVNIVYNEAVIVPQTVADGEKFIEVTLSTGTVLTYELDAETTFASGKKHQYKITVNLTSLTVSSTIENWDPITAKEGIAEME